MSEWLGVIGERGIYLVVFSIVLGTLTENSCALKSLKGPQPSLRLR